MSFSLFDLKPIYSTEYQYSFPQKSLEEMISGNAFDYKKEYTQEESEALRADGETLYKEMTSQPSAKEGWAYIFAGAPGAGKTVLLNNLRDKMQNETKKYTPYVCPDDVCLKNMNKTYKADLGLNYTKEDMEKAYTKWRPGSNALLNLLLANLINASLRIRK